jgi:hypothetical protein
MIPVFSIKRYLGEKWKNSQRLLVVTISWGCPKRLTAKAQRTQSKEIRLFFLPFYLIFFNFLAIFATLRFKFGLNRQPLRYSSEPKNRYQ